MKRTVSRNIMHQLKEDKDWHQENGRGDKKCLWQMRYFYCQVAIRLILIQLKIILNCNIDHFQRIQLFCCPRLAVDFFFWLLIHIQNRVFFISSFFVIVLWNIFMHTWYCCLSSVVCRLLLLGQCTFHRSTRMISRRESYHCTIDSYNLKIANRYLEFSTLF